MSLEDNISECSSIDLKSLQSEADSHTTLFPIKSYYETPETVVGTQPEGPKHINASILTTDCSKASTNKMSFGAHFHMMKLSASVQSCSSLEILGTQPSLSHVPMKSPFPSKKAIIYSSSSKMIPKLECESPQPANDSLASNNSFASIHRERFDAMGLSRAPPISVDPAKESHSTKQNALSCTRKLQKYRYGVSPLERINVLQRDLDHVSEAIASGKTPRLSARVANSRPQSRNYEFRPFDKNEQKVPILTEASRGSITIPSVSAAVEDDLVLHSARIALSRSEPPAPQDIGDEDIPGLSLSPKSSRPPTRSGTSKRRETSSPSRSNIVEIGHIAYTASALKPDAAHHCFVLEDEDGGDARRDIATYHKKKRLMANIGETAGLVVPEQPAKKCSDEVPGDVVAADAPIDVQIFARRTESTLTNDSEAADVLMTTLNTLHAEEKTNTTTDRLLCMESRYVDGKSQMTIRSAYTTAGGQPQQLSSAIRTASENPLSMNSLMRAPPICVQCITERACLWCLECQYSYCRRCWNTIPHHKYITPDELWNTRQPLHSIEKCSPLDPPVHVYFDSKGEIKQGLVERKRSPCVPGRHHHPTSAFRNLAPMKSSTNVQTWANLNDSRSFTPEGFGEAKSAAEKAYEAEKHRLKSPLKSPFKGRRETATDVEHRKSRRKKRRGDKKGDEAMREEDERKVPIFQASGNGVSLTRSMQPRRDAHPLRGIIRSVLPVEVDNSNGMKRREIEVHKGKPVYVRSQSRRNKERSNNLKWEMNDSKSEREMTEDGEEDDLKHGISASRSYNTFTDTITEEANAAEDSNSCS